MHSATCPACGTRVELDFQPTAGLVWCPKCQKAFSVPVASGAESCNDAHDEQPSHRNGKAE